MSGMDSVNLRRYGAMTYIVVFVLLAVSSSAGSIDHRITALEPVRIEMAGAKVTPEPLSTEELIQEMLSHD